MEWLLIGEAMPKTSIVFLSHYINEILVQRFQSLVEECKAPGCDVTLLYDKTRSVCPEIPGQRVYSFDLESIGSLGFRMFAHGVRRPGVVPGNTDYPLLAYFLEHGDYDYYWLIEHDVRFSGRWRRFFDICSASRSDLLTTHVQRFQENVRWFWWGSLTYQSQPVDDEIKVRAFLPVYRLSNAACRVLVESCRSGWNGHFETRLPTILHLNNCTLEDLGGEGSFVPAGHENRFYLGEGCRPALASTFRWRPVMKRPGILADKLWHPVKDGE